VGEADREIKRRRIKPQISQITQIKKGKGSVAKPLLTPCWRLNLLATKHLGIRGQVLTAEQQAPYLVLCRYGLFFNNPASSWHENGLISGRLPGSGQAALARWSAPQRFRLSSVPRMLANRLEPPDKTQAP
jgi:hypothetical protein